jgi:hypothetical protein
MAKSTREQVLTDIQREIEEELNRSPVHALSPENVAPPIVAAPTPAMPDYVEHRDGATEIGKLSAEAVVREFEAAAKEIESMGAELIERVKQCEAMTRNAFAVTKELRDVAARYREEGKRVFFQIETCSLVTAEVSKACAELKEKLASPTR